MNRRRVRMAVGAACLAMLVPCVLATPVLNYQGRVESGGIGYHGNAQFKFLLHDGGGHALWSNDGTAGMSEPAGSVTLWVERGLFHTELGNTDAGMAALSPVIFHRNNVMLRTWFSTNGVNFVELSPDVSMRPTALGLVDTGRMLVVDAAGSADFDDIQSAIDYVSTNHLGEIVYVMPGYYRLDAPLRFPAHERVSVMGALPEGVTICNTNGAALIVGEGTLRNVSLRGNPAISDAGVTEGCNFNLYDCHVGGFSGMGPAVSLTSTAGVTIGAFQSSIYHDGSGSGIEIGGTASLRARECTVYTPGAAADTPSVRVSGGGFLTILDTWVFGAPVALRADGLTGAFTCRNCDLEGAIVVSNLQTGMEIEGSNIMANAPPLAAVAIQGGTVDNRVFFRDCKIFSSGKPVVHLAAASGCRASAALDGCSVWLTGGTGAYAAVLTNDEANETDNLQMNIARSTVLVADILDAGAVSVSHARLSVDASIISGHHGYGIRSEAGGEVTMDRSEVEGGVAGVRATGPESSVEMTACTIGGGDSGTEGPAIWAEGDVRVLLFSSEASGDGSGAEAIGMRLDPVDDDGPWAVIGNSILFGGSRALRATGLSYVKAAGAMFVTESGIPAELRAGDAPSGPPETAFGHCLFFRLAPAALPAVLLGGASPPNPIIANCEIDATGHTACFGLDGASSASIRLGNSFLSADVGTGITLEARTELGNGNYRYSP